jgi:TraM recognition site of TraD and TraG/Helicase HerA, central domain
VASKNIGTEDMLFHALYIGSTGAGKTNALLYWLLRLFSNRKDVALVLIDPHGDAAFDLIRLVPESERERIAILDPNFVSFGLNPLSLPQGTEVTNRVQVLQTQVEELSALLSDVFNTDASTAPRLMWIFKGALYYLYTLSDNPTFKDLYRILVDFISLPKEMIERMLRYKDLKDEIIRSTIDAISKLQKEAFAPVVNRISNFVLPPQSMTSRTFCARTSKLDFDEMTQPGRLTIFRITKSLPYDFRRLISASIVMRFYFAVEKRAARLERAGEPPSARTPIILAIDEFQNISDLKLLDTILSESRKYGLYLWMVNQNIQQIRDQLYSAITGNVGPIFCFRVGPDDASKMAELISPRSAEEVRKALISLPDYTCVVRKRPHGEDVASKPLLIEPFPKVRDPLCQMKDVIDFMKNQMEERYGGAEEATDLVYKSLKDQLTTAAGGDTSDASRVSFMPIHWRILTMACLKALSDQYSVEFSRLRSELYQKYGWTTSDVQQALNDLVNTGYMTQVFTLQDYIIKGKDEFENPIRVPPDPSNMDDMERAKTVVYSLTLRALDLFKMRVGPSKMGDPKHARVIEKLLKEEYWPLGNYCVVDWGQTSKEMPDIAVLKPAPKTIKDKLGNDKRISNPYVWDYTTATAVEIEMSPLKSKDQVLKNYQKNKTFYEQIRFVVTSENHKQELLQILNEGQPADPTKYRIDVIEFEKLNEIRTNLEVEREGEPKKLETPKMDNQVGRTEELILDYILTNGFTSREEISQRCGGQGIEIGVRSVSRYLKILTAKGLLRREGKKYLPTDLARNRDHQGTL